MRGAEQVGYYSGRTRAHNRSNLRVITHVQAKTQQSVYLPVHWCIFYGCPLGLGSIDIPTLNRT